MFSEELKNISWEETTERIAGMTETDVRRALSKSHLNVSDFMALISPAAEPYLETMARLSRHYTEERFGRTMSMFIPLYITNACTNSCVYCGFHRENPMARTILTPEQIENEYRAIKKLAPFENILLVTGEHPAKAGVPYLAKAIDIAKRYFSNIKIEVMPLEAEEYKELTRHGLNGVICFQETYHKDNYQFYHPRGMKSRFEWRCDGFDRMGQAGVHSIGMGVLIGLEKEWRTDVTMMAHHLRYLQKHYWRTKYSINFPRMRPAQNEGFQPNCIMTDRQLAQATFAMRIFDHDVDISYSTREPAYIRDNMCTLGVTTMSAESKVNPGGYHTYPQALEQFTVSDERTAKEIELRLKQLGREPVWKDWDASFDRVSSLSSLPVILLTLPDFFEGETDIVNKLFAGTLSHSSATTMANGQWSMVNGPWRLHLRKPEATKEQLAGWIEEIEPRFRNRIVLHDHYDLALQYGLGGIHLNRRNASLPHNFTESTKPTGFTLSRSCHTIEEVKACQDDFDYVFLSPIFDSISKQGYMSAFSKEELTAARDILSKNVFALGGVTFERLRTVQDLGFHGAAMMGGFWK